MAAMQDDTEQIRSDGNGDRQECPPSAEGDNEKGTSGDRTPNGRFANGNRAAAGHGPRRPTKQFRTALYGTAELEHVAAITRQLLSEALTKKEWAIRLALQYLVGPPSSLELEQRIDALERKTRGTKP
jgi:hypothetical protein